MPSWSRRCRSPTWRLFKDLLMRPNAIALLAGVWLVLVAAAAAAADADLILHRGKIITVDKKFSIHQALAIKDGRILRVGTSEHVLSVRGPGTQMVDLGGKTVLPGLIDSHVHPADACITEFDHPIPVM